MTDYVPRSALKSSLGVSKPEPKQPVKKARFYLLITNKNMIYIFI
jgi:hypothetical protein